MFNTWNQKPSGFDPSVRVLHPLTIDVAAQPAQEYSLIAERAVCDGGGLSGFGCSQCGDSRNGLGGLNPTDIIPADSQIVWEGHIQVPESDRDNLEIVRSYLYSSGLFSDVSQFEYLAGWYVFGNPYWRVYLTNSIPESVARYQQAIEDIMRLGLAVMAGNQTPEQGYRPFDTVKFTVYPSAARIPAGTAAQTGIYTDRSGTQTESQSTTQTNKARCEAGYRWRDNVGCVKDHGWFGNFLADLGLEVTPTTMVGAGVITALLAITLLRTA